MREMVKVKADHHLDPDKNERYSLGTTRGFKDIISRTGTSVDWSMSTSLLACSGEMRTDAWTPREDDRRGGY
ncbi:6679_t:CDS:2 [Acaulospora colombiana]|uniref:6679_t:CDS:1 n=1 Tax=Acaulospora colombiana TaxID=27376 RepID=A0ACA9P8I6_9GLOM|nr:6679_t:CDS:2 [Acaulospora colombiana]